jgi:hypothetical protein
MNDDNLCELYANLLWRPVFYFLFLKSFDLIYFFARSEVFVRLFLFSTAANIISVIGCAVGYVFRGIIRPDFSPRTLIGRILFSMVCVGRQ